MSVLNILNNSNCIITEVELSKNAINFLEKQFVSDGDKRIIEKKFIFQIVYVERKIPHWYRCSLIDQNSKFDGFCIKYDDQFGIPKEGDIIQTNHVQIVKLPNRDNYLYFCDNVKKISEAFELMKINLGLIGRNKELNKNNNNINNEIKHYNKNKSFNKNKEYNNHIGYNNNNINKEYTLYQDLLSKDNIQHPIFYLKCLIKYGIKDYASKSDKSDGKMQNYYFLDTEGDSIKVVCFGMSNIKYFDQLILPGNVYEISNMDIQKNKGDNSNIEPFKFMITKYKTSIRQLTNKDDFTIIRNINGKLLTKIVDLKREKLGKSLCVVGIVLEDRGIMGLSSKDNKYRFLIMGDNSFHRIVVKLWTKIINPEKKFSKGDIVYMTYLYYNESSIFNQLVASKRTEVFYCQPSPIQQELTLFYQQHSNLYEYKSMNLVYLHYKKDIQFKFISELIHEKQKGIQNYQNNKPIKICGRVLNCNHRKANVSFFCENCSRKVEVKHFENCKGKQKVILKLFIEIKDCSGKIFIELHEFTAENFLKISANEYIKAINENNEEKINEINRRILYKNYIFYGKTEPSLNKFYSGFTVYQIDEINAEYYKSLIPKLSQHLK